MPLLFALAFLLCQCGSTQSKDITETKPPEQVRQSVIAGSWYPGSPTELSGMIQGFLERVPEQESKGQLLALIAPHAGYVFSGQVAAYSYKLLEKQKFQSVIIISPSHQMRFPGVATYELGGFQTPLGVVPLDYDLIARIKKREARIVHLPEAHSKEHALEIQLPFLQTVMPGFKLVPLIMGEQDYSTCKWLADALADAVRGKSVLIVASSDLSHYHSYDQARALDKVLIDRVNALDPQGLSDSLARGECEACGGGPIVAAMLTAVRLGANVGQVLYSANSGDATGNKNDLRGVVGYLAGALWKNDAAAASAASPPGDVGTESRLTPDERKILHRIARESIEAKLRGDSPPKIEPAKMTANLKEPRGAFVTLQKHGDLRGCIGHMVTSQLLYQTITEVAVAAAFQDPRFMPVTPDEFKELSIEISVLTPLKKISNVEEIKVGVHGILMQRGGAGGVLLPQVATEYGWDRKTFLENTCLKARLPIDAWKDDKTEIYIFSAEVF